MSETIDALFGELQEARPRCQALGRQNGSIYLLRTVPVDDATLQPILDRYGPQVQVLYEFSLHPKRLREYGLFPLDPTVAEQFDRRQGELVTIMARE